jgi:hypothetical protein
LVPVNALYLKHMSQSPFIKLDETQVKLNHLE